MQILNIESHFTDTLDLIPELNTQIYCVFLDDVYLQPETIK